MSDNVRRTRIGAAYRQRDATPELLQSIQLEMLYESLCVIQQVFLLGDDARNRTAQIARVIARHYYHYCYHLSEKKYASSSCVLYSDQQN